MTKKHTKLVIVRQLITESIVYEVRVPEDFDVNSLEYSRDFHKLVTQNPVIPCGSGNGETEKWELKSND